ncbi:DUF6998 domain-containing protein [Chloroflexota bacterium]
MTNTTNYKEVITIQQAVRQLLKIVRSLHKVHPIKKFTLDGRLVGDIGEVLAAQKYDIQLFDGIVKHHDAHTSDGRSVQIKATMKKALTFPGDHIPDYYLGIKIHEDGTFTEIFNGPGKIAWEAIKNRKNTKINLHMISLSKLEDLNKKVREEDRIPIRSE